MRVTADQAKSAPAATQPPKRAYVVHPFVWGPFFVLSLYADNAEHFPLSQTLVPAGVLLAATAILWAIGALTLRSARKSGLAVSLFMVLFLGYGYIQEGAIHALGAQVGRHRVILPSLTLIGLVGVFFVWRSRRALLVPTRVLNIMAGSLLAVIVARVGFQQVVSWSPAPPADAQEASEAIATSAPASGQLPNIFHIILDCYGRADVLKDLYGYDNSKFLGFLANKGFYVANQARSNYCQTSLCMAAYLNMRYIDRAKTAPATQSGSRDPLIRQIVDNRLCRTLRDHGYEIVMFSSGYYATENISGTRIFRPERISEFEYGLISTTPIPVVLKNVLGVYKLHRERILYTLDNLPEAGESDGPVFVFAHIHCPHPPFVFGPQGQPRDPGHRFSIADGSHWYALSRSNDQQLYRQHYADQLAYLNLKLKGTVEQILARADRPTVIVLQGDHGPGSMLDKYSAERTNVTERMTILSAYYFPDGAYETLYESITPVNSFRVVLNRYLGAQLPMLADRCYFSTSSDPYGFVDVTDRVQVPAAR